MEILVFYLLLIAHSLLLGIYMHSLKTVKINTGFAKYVVNCAININPCPFKYFIQRWL